MNLEVKEMTNNEIKNNKAPTVCLNMIVKNESKVIMETLLNLSKYINFDYWVISDTGSTDGTQDMIQTFFWNKGIPGELVNHEWRDFGYNRTKALEAAYNKTDYLFIFDADDSLHGDFKLPFDKPLADRYMLRIGQGFEYVRPLLINNRKRWEFKGVLHEYLSNMEPCNPDITITGNYYIESGRTGNRSQNPTKYYDDAIILKNAYEKELALPDKGMSGRYAFYCARSYKDAGVKYHDDAIIWYKKVIDAPNHWNQERFYSALEIGHIYRQKKNMEEATKYFLKTVEYDIERIEGIVLAVEHFYQTGQYIVVNSLYHKFKNYKQDCVPKLGEKLFVTKMFYNDRLEFFNGIIAYYMNDKLSGYNCCKQVLINQIAGDNEINITLNNLIFYKEILEQDKDTLPLFQAIDNLLYKNNELVYNNNIVELWNILLKQNKMQLTVLSRNNIKKVTSKKSDDEESKKEKILITFTTCKRLNLFKETINSILNQWLDIDLIANWFCVDDNSSKEDRQFMKSTYHWMDYYMKTPSEKGHRTSMNIIWNKLHDLKPDYWIHMEDDFLFYHPMNYVTLAIAALKNKTAVSMGIKQIVFNRNYAETIDNYKSKGHLPTSIPNIVLHDHKPNESITHYQNTHYWPHYSFRPSMLDVKPILKLGNYNSPNKFFERDYADKWDKANYKTAFFDRITHKHTGRLTHEISSGTVKNAYELNGEAQFNGEENAKYIKLLNLERRPDRKLQMTKLLNDVGRLSNDYSIFKAVDGNELEPTLELKLLFDGNDFGSRRGVIGCALSHLKMWRELLADKYNSYYVIMEDDFSLSPGFKEQFDKLQRDFETKEVIFMGYHMYAKKRADVKSIYDVINANTLVKVKPLNKDLYIGGTFAYSINKVGAKKLIDYIETKGIKHGIDYLMKIAPELNSCELQPHLAFSDWNEAGTSGVDTDIQNNYQALDFNKTVEDQFDFIPQQDQIGHDLYYHRDLSLGEYMLKAIKDKNCVGFNTLGFFKSKIEKLTSSQYFREKDGIYLKKGAAAPLNPCHQDIVVEMASSKTSGEEVVRDSGKEVVRDSGKEVVRDSGKEVVRDSGEEVVRDSGETSGETSSETSGETLSQVCAGVFDDVGVSQKGVLLVKLLCNWCSSEQLCYEWSNMCNNNDYVWTSPISNKSIKITWKDDSPIDYYVVINYPRKSENFVPEKTVVFQMEPSVSDENKNWGVKTWGEWVNPDPAKFLKVFTHKTHLNNVQWQIDHSFYDKTLIIDNERKKNKVATVCSFKNFDTGHILRNSFIKYVDNDNCVIDVFGMQNYRKVKNYCGMLPDDDKFNAYAKYKYCLAAENNMEHNYATEKIWEPILCESLCFYWGCPNLEEYIDERAFVRLPLEDPAAAFATIQQAIAEDWWSQRIEVIKQMKEKILNELGFFPLLERLFFEN